MISGHPLLGSIWHQCNVLKKPIRDETHRPVEGVGHIQLLARMRSEWCWRGATGKHLSRAIDGLSHVVWTYVELIIKDRLRVKQATQMGLAPRDIKGYHG